MRELSRRSCERIIHIFQPPLAGRYGQFVGFNFTANWLRCNPGGGYERVGACNTVPTWGGCFSQKAVKGYWERFLPREEPYAHAGFRHSDLSSTSRGVCTVVLPALEQLYTVQETRVQCRRKLIEGVPTTWYGAQRWRNAISPLQKAKCSAFCSLRKVGTKSPAGASS